MNLPACPNCGQTYAVNATTRMATPGARTTPVSTVVPNEDVYGTVQGHRVTTTDRWVQQGAPVPSERTDEGYVWACVCGTSDVFMPDVRLVNVSCRHQAPEGGFCRVRENQVNPPSDLYVNARHGARCECCGHQGTHQVPVSKVQAFVLPACLRS